MIYIQLRSLKGYLRRNRDFQLKPAVLRDTHKLANQKGYQIFNALDKYMNLRT